MLNYEKEIEPIEGLITKKEALFLYEQARKVNGDEAIVEIGSFEGKSTVCLGQGAQDGGGAMVYAVDPHVGSWEHRLLLDEIDTFEKFKENIERTGLEEVVVPVKMKSGKAGKRFEGRVGLLFVDGAHKLSNVKQDYRLWFPELVEGGDILFHDSFHIVGPHLVSAWLLWTSSEVRNPRFVDSITALEKTARASLRDRLRNILFWFYRFVPGLWGLLKVKAVNLGVLIRKT